jgi:hypothetical protein
MKPTSIIFLIVAVVLMAAGLATCFIATNMAEDSGVLLYSQTLDENKNYVFTSDLSNIGTTKFEIEVKDCNVNIIGDSETSYVEIVNFKEGMYSYNITGKIITLDETPSISAMLKFWENGFKFKGMRHIIKLGADSSLEDKQKSVNVYLTKADEAKIINLRVENGDVNITSMYSQTDYDITLNGGDVRVASLRTTSNLLLKGDKCNLFVDQSFVRNLTVDIGEGNIVSKYYTFSNLDIHVDTGDVHIESTREVNNFNINLSSKEGHITFDGENLSGNYQNDNEKGTGTIKITTDSANITLNKSTAAPIADPALDETEAADGAA